MNALAPLPSRDGKKIFFVGELRRGELVRFDDQKKEFAPYISGISAELLSFSRDGRWMTFVSYPEGTLWRSKSDGSNRLQLTSAPMKAGLSRWSPDGKQIAFTASQPGRPWRVYVVSANGGALQEVESEKGHALDPDWSADGNSLVFGTRGAFQGGDLLLTQRYMSVTSRLVSSRRWLIPWASLAHDSLPTVGTSRH